MFKFTNKKKTKLEVEIDLVLDDMKEMYIDSDEYKASIEHLSKLYDIKSKDDTGRVSPDTMAVVVGNLLGIVLILKHEELNIVTSKALGFVLRGRA